MNGIYQSEKTLKLGINHKACRLESDQRLWPMAVGIELSNIDLNIWIDLGRSE